MNIVISSSPYTEQDLKTLYCGEDIIYYDGVNELSVMLTQLGLYKSSSQARKANRYGPIPSGWTEFKGNKTTTVWIWNPSE